MRKDKLVKRVAEIKLCYIERDILAKVRGSNFLLSLEHAFQDDTTLYIVMRFMRGGSLRYHLNEQQNPNGRKCFASESTARFYAAEMLLGLHDLHKNHIVYRDLKPENALLDLDGHLRLSDFGLSVFLDEKKQYRTTRRAGTDGYKAPEMMAGQPYGVAIDMYALGVAIHEMLAGRRLHQCMQNADPLKHKVNISQSLSANAQHLIAGLCHSDEKKRLGSGPTGVEEIKAHPFFKGIDWKALAELKVKAPMKPDPLRANCSNEADLDDQLLTSKPKMVSGEQQALFQKFRMFCEIREPYKRELLKKFSYDPHAASQAASSFDDLKVSNSNNV
jgi:serine/threonine protein kinase